MRIGGTRVVHLTIIVNSYDNGKTQTNYLGFEMSLSTTTKSDKFIHKKISDFEHPTIRGEAGA